MSSLKPLWLGIFLALSLAAPAQATCLMRESPLPQVRISLAPEAGGKTISRTTGMNGEVRLRRLRSGAWRAWFPGSSDVTTLNVTRDGRLTIRAITQTTSCHAPPRPDMPPPAPPTVRRVIKQVHSD